MARSYLVSSRVVSWNVWCHSHLFATFAQQVFLDALSSKLQSHKHFASRKVALTSQLHNRRLNVDTFVVLQLKVCCNMYSWLSYSRNRLTSRSASRVSASRTTPARYCTVSTVSSTRTRIISSRTSSDYSTTGQQWIETLPHLCLELTCTVLVF